MKISRCIYITIIPLILLMVGCYEPPVSGDDSASTPVIWKGMLESAPMKPEVNWVYYDIQLKTSFIFDGIVWDTMVVKGIDGVSMQWLGTLTQAPTEPTINSAYYDATLNTAFIFTGTTWDTLTCGGQDGLSIQWKGNLEQAPTSPQENWIYFDLQQKKTLIYSNAMWQEFLPGGLSGISLQWLGRFESHPEMPPVNGAYYNTIKRCSYLFDGTAWVIISRDGTEGESGNSIVWLGEKLYAPVDPLVNWAYFSMIDYNSYIFDGTEWQVLALSGKQGISIIWMGELDRFPKPPKLNWAFFHKGDGNSYIYNGQNWSLLAASGEDGENGTSLVWLGTFDKAPTQAAINNIYYNSRLNTTYIYTETGWQVFAIGGSDGLDGWDGTDGEDGDDLNSLCAHKSQYIWSGDTLFLDHYFGTYGTTFIGQYVNPHDSTARSYDDRDPSWYPPYDSVYAKELYTKSKKKQERVLFTRNDGSIIQVYDEREELYKGGILITLGAQGIASAPFRFCDSYVSHIAVHENPENALYITYINEEKDSTAFLTIITKENVVTHHQLTTTKTKSIKSAYRSDGSLLFIYPHETGFQFQTFLPDSTITPPQKFAENAIDSTYSIELLKNGKVQFFGITTNLISATIALDNSVSETSISDIDQAVKVFDFVEQSSGTMIVPISLRDTLEFQEKNLVIMQITPGNHVTKIDTLSMNCVSINLDLLENDTLSVLFRIKITNLMITYHMILSPDLEKLSESMLHDLLQEPATAVKNGEIYVTHTYHEEENVVHFLRLRKSHHYPELVLKVLNSNKAGLINHTGRCLLLTLTAYDKPLLYQDALRKSNSLEMKDRSSVFTGCVLPKRF